jgi:flagellar hook-associated protein 2
LNFAQDKFNKVIAENPRGVSAFIRGDGFKTGFATTLKREITNLLDGQFGTISNRKRGIESRIKQTNTRIENKERQLEKKEMSLRKKFADLETKMSDLASQNARVAALQTQGA